MNTDHNHQCIRKFDHSAPDDAKAGLLLQFYEPLDMDRVTMMNKDKPFTLQKEKWNLKTERMERRNINLFWNLKTRHIAGTPIAVYFHKQFGRIVAFDLDKNLDNLPLKQRLSEQEKNKENTIRFLKMLYLLNLKPIAYYSGKKGYHFFAYFPSRQPANQKEPYDRRLDSKKPIYQGSLDITCVDPTPEKCAKEAIAVIRNFK